MYVPVLAVSPESCDLRVSLVTVVSPEICVHVCAGVGSVPAEPCSHATTHVCQQHRPCPHSAVSPGASHATFLPIHIPPSPPCPCSPVVLPLPGRARSRWEGSGECGIVARGWSHR